MQSVLLHHRDDILAIRAEGDADMRAGPGQSGGFPVPLSAFPNSGASVMRYGQPFPFGIEGQPAHGAWVFERLRPRGAGTPDMNGPAHGAGHKAGGGVCGQAIDPRTAKVSQLLDAATRRDTQEAPVIAAGDNGIGAGRHHRQDDTAVGLDLTRRVVTGEDSQDPVAVRRHHRFAKRQRCGDRRAGLERPPLGLEPGLGEARARS